jgi:flagellar FliL protein
LHIYAVMSGAANKLDSLRSAPLPPTPPKHRPSVWFLTSVIVLAILAGGGSAWLVVQRGRADQPPQVPEVSTVPRYLAHLEGFTVNLADPEETHFLRVTMDLGFDHLPEGVSKDKVSSAMPVSRIRDSILRVLTLCRAEPLLTGEGKAQLKHNLIASLNKDVPELGVRDVYFTEFLVQR